MDYSLPILAGPCNSCQWSVLACSSDDPSMRQASGATASLDLGSRCPNMLLSEIGQWHRIGNAASKKRRRGWGKKKWLRAIHLGFILLLSTVMIQTSLQVTSAFSPGGFNPEFGS